MVVAIDLRLASFTWLVGAADKVPQGTSMLLIVLDHHRNLQLIIDVHVDVQWLRVQFHKPARADQYHEEVGG